jgi:hypothetical protein
LCPGLGAEALEASGDLAALEAEASHAPPLPRAAGPVNIHENVLRAMHVPGQNHRDPWFAEFYKCVGTWPAMRITAPHVLAAAAYPLEQPQAVVR